MYVVAGASGRTGSIVADALLAAGKPVRVIVREGLRGDPWRARGAEVAVASLDQPAGLARALAGATGAYLLSPQDMRSPDPISDGWRIADAIARAVAEAAPGHVVVLSAIGARHAEGTGVSRTLHAAEERLADAGSPLTFLRAAFFLENWAPGLHAALAGQLPTFIHPDRVVPMVATRDVGRAAARLLLEGPRAPRDVVALLGPRDPSPRVIADALARLLGRPVEPVHAPAAAVEPLFASFGASPAFAAQVRELYEGIAAGKLDGNTGERVVRGSVEIEDFVREVLGERS